MRALFLIPRSSPPRLKKSKKWSKRFEMFVDTVLNKDYRQRPFTDSLLKHAFVRDLPLPQHQIRNMIKDHIDRHRRVNKKDETEYEYSGSEDEENAGHNGHSRNGNRHPPNVDDANDDTMRKLQRIQEPKRAFEHAGPQQLKRMPNGQPHFNDINAFHGKQPMGPAGYRGSAAGGYPKESPREHVKMRHDPRLGPQPRIGAAGMPAPGDYRRHSRPVSHHQAVS
jgi:hypothetical protein